jgi:hypothetical protein
MLGRMTATYAVVWRNGDERLASGRLELGAAAVHLVGNAGGAVVRTSIPYAELQSVEIGRAADERIDGRQTVVLRSRFDGAIRIAGLTQVWVVSELVERLAALVV